jgi:hypothetical protein
MIAECQSCGEKMPIGQLLTIETQWLGLKDDEPEPEGVCPCCGGWAYLMDLR